MRSRCGDWGLFLQLKLIPQVARRLNRIYKVGSFFNWADHSAIFGPILVISTRHPRQNLQMLRIWRGCRVWRLCRATNNSNSFVFSEYTCGKNMEIHSHSFTSLPSLWSDPFGTPVTINWAPTLLLDLLVASFDPMPPVLVSLPQKPAFDHLFSATCMRTWLILLPILSVPTASALAGVTKNERSSLIGVMIQQ